MGLAILAQARTLNPEPLTPIMAAGDDVTKKKPDPLIYNMARERLGGLPADRCVVIEDSLVGLRWVGPMDESH